MKSDLDRLMEANHIDALLIPASENEDPYRAYLSNGAAFSGIVIKKSGSPPVLSAISRLPPIFPSMRKTLSTGLAMPLLDSERKPSK